jgi:hypothetical protein
MTILNDSSNLEKVPIVRVLKLRETVEDKTFGGNANITILIL